MRDKPDIGQCLQGHVVSGVAEQPWELFPGEFCCPLTCGRPARSPCRAEMGEGGGKECGWSWGKPVGGEGVASLPRRQVQNVPRRSFQPWSYSKITWEVEDGS